MPSAVAKLFRVSRPISWVNTAFPFAATYLVLGGTLDPIMVIGTLFFLIPYNLLMYGVNDVFDYESDIKNPRKGSLEGAVEARSFHPVILWACFATTVPFAVVLAILVGWQASLVLAGVLFFVVAYSLKGLRFKEIPVLDSVTSSLHFVGPLIFAAACLGFPTEIWPYALAFFLWGMASHAFGAVQDIIPDRAGGLASIATVFGARTTVWLSVALYGISIFVTALQGGAALWVAAAGLLYVANVAPYLFVTDRDSAVTNHGWKRFIWVNYAVGFVVTMALIFTYLGLV